MKALSLLIVALLGSCADDDTTIHTSLTFAFQVRGQDADNDGTVVDEVPIDLSEGAPWLRFSDQIASAFAQPPGTLTLDGVSLRLLDTSQGVQDLGDVFNGPLALRYRTNGDQNEYSLAVIDIRAANEATFAENFLIEFDYQRIEASDQEKIIAGQMQALFVGQSSDGFRDSGSVADIVAQLAFSATAPSAP